MNTLTEYDISFAVKEFLLKRGYTIVTWNPPGSQGTFTIPNPAKDPLYRGQVGSESPDIIAYQGTTMLLVEAKDSISKSFADIEKISRLLADHQRRALLLNICRLQMEAIGNTLDTENMSIETCIAVPDATDILSKYAPYQQLNKIFAVSLQDEEWDKNCFDDTVILDDVYNVREIELN